MVAAPLLAALLAALGQILGWRGVDYAAQLYRIDNFKAHGLGLWDLQWYGGNWTLDYSVIFPPLAAALGVATVTILSAAGAALAFDRLARRHFGSGALMASLLFAAGTAVQASIGQLPFLSGEAFGLGAVWAASRRQWVLSALLALAATLCSPLAGAFIVIGMASWALWRWRALHHHRFAAQAAIVIAAAAAPVVAAAALFPGTGSMPYPVVDYLFELVVAGGLWLAAGREQPALRTGIVVYAAAATVAVAVPSPIGGNIGRLEDILALPLAAAFLWPRRYQIVRGAAIAAAMVPLALSQWGPAWGAITSDASQPSTHEPFYTPLITVLQRAAAGGPAGRVEVVPTAYHWEATYVAPVMPLARGWERQLDVSDNPLFYRTGALTPATYRAWLLDDGVRFVALANAPLDSAARAEGSLVASGAVPGLQLIWQSVDWRLYSVDGSPGIVQSPDRLVSASGNQLVVDAARPGPVLIRVRYNADWSMANGVGCISRGGGDWISVLVPWPEQFTLALSLLGDERCESGGVAAPGPGRDAPTATR